MRFVARMFDIAGKAGADIRDFPEKDIVEFDLRSKNGRCCGHALQHMELNMSFPVSHLAVMAGLDPAIPIRGALPSQAGCAGQVRA